MRKYMANRRKNEKKNKEIGACKQPVNRCKQISPYTDTDTDTDKRLKKGQNGFDLFWEAYPKKVKKKTAREIWARKKPDADTLVRDVQNRLANDSRWTGGFIPDPTTYLNQERWDDEISQPKSDSYHDQIRRAVANADD